jgi:prepilin-type N-terminal cleavage/methylation domain-containing protein
MITFSNTSVRRGFTLVESLMSVLIVSGVLVAALGTLGAIGKGRQAQVERAAAIHLGDQFMAEVMQCYFQEPGSPTGSILIGADAGESQRTQYDDVDDWENWKTSDPPKLRDGTVMPGYTGWEVKLKVDHALLTDPMQTSNIYTGLKRIKVVVKTPGGGAYTMYGLRSSNGVYEQAPTSMTTYLTFGGVWAQVGDKGKTIYGGAHPLNITTSQ